MKKDLFVWFIVFLVGLFMGVGLTYSPEENGDLWEAQLEEKDRIISDLQRQISLLQAEIQNLTDYISYLKSLIPPVRAGEWSPLRQFTGGGSDFTSDYFYVTGTDLNITWILTPENSGFFAIALYLYPEGEDWIEIIGIETKQGYTYIHGLEPGYYYIKIESFNIDHWEITIEEWIPET